MRPDLARGYIASGEFNGNRVPQHIQNQIIKLYCDTNNLHFILSRAEYSFSKTSLSQLWAALQEGYKHIVFFSIWQLPMDQTERQSIYEHCLLNSIYIHFAVERIMFSATSSAQSDNIEVLIKSFKLMLNRPDKSYLDNLAKLTMQ